MRTHLRDTARLTDAVSAIIPGVATTPPQDVDVREPLPGVRGLFQQRVAGDDALLRLTGLRFAQAGMPAELYADTPEQLDRLLGFVPEHATLPVVHLNRGVVLLDAGGRETLRAFARAFAGRISGLVVHDKANMVTRTPEV